MIEYDKWPVVYEDEEIKVRRNPKDPERYEVAIVNSRDKSEELLYMVLPRGTLADIALSDRQKGKQKIEVLALDYYNELNRKNPRLTIDSIIAAITKAYLIEEKAYQEFLKK